MPDATAPPGVAPDPATLMFGVQPRYLPSSPPVKSPTWPEIDHVGPPTRPSVTLIGLIAPVDCRYVPLSSASVRVTLRSAASMVHTNSPGSTSCGTSAVITCCPEPGVGGSGSGSGSPPPLSVPYPTVIALP